MKRYEQCILATCPVPWDENYNFAEDIFRNQIDHIIKYGTKHIYIFGTAGEGYAVSDSQFNRITSVFAKQMIAAGAQPMVGVISLSLPTIIERIEYSYNLGVRFFQLSLPAWGECTFDEVRSFFNETCGRFKDCSFLHYNTIHSKRLISPNEYTILAEQFENLVATKNGAGSVVQIVSLARKTPQLRHFFTEMNFATAAMMGLDAGLLISISSINWKRARLFYHAGLNRQIDELSGYVVQLEEILGSLLRIIGRQGHIDGAYDKLYSKIADAGFPLRLLPPYGYAKDESFFEFVSYLREHYPMWIDDNGNKCTK